MTDQEIKNSITEKALEYGAPSEYSELFDSLPKSFRVQFNESISGRNFGLPIVKYGHSNGNWIIIGTKDIAKVIVNGIKSGWNPKENGKPFIIKLDNSFIPNSRIK